MAVPIQCIIEFCNNTLEEPAATPDEHIPEVGDYHSDTEAGEMAGDIHQNPPSQHDGDNQQDPIVTAEAIDVACSIVKSCLAQICM